MRLGLHPWHFPSTRVYLEEYLNLEHLAEKKGKDSELRATREKEEALKRSEQKFEALVQKGFDLMSILESDGNYLVVSNLFNFC